MNRRVFIAGLTAALLSPKIDQEWLNMAAPQPDSMWHYPLEAAIDIDMQRWQSWVENWHSSSGLLYRRQDEAEELRWEVLRNE